MNDRNGSHRGVAVTALLALALGSALGLFAPAAAGADVSPAEKEAYRQAMVDASQPQQVFISMFLLALVPECRYCFRRIHIDGFGGCELGQEDGSI